MSFPDEFHFMRGGVEDGWSQNYATDAKMKTFACCIASQQQAGFKETLDLRETKCPDCGAPGFNTGWGYWFHACGAEYLSDGELSKKCTPSSALGAKHE